MQANCVGAHTNGDRQACKEPEVMPTCANCAGLKTANMSQGQAALKYIDRIKRNQEWKNQGNQPMAFNAAASMKRENVN